MDSRMQALLLKKEESILEREALIKHMENRQRELEFEKEDEANRKKEREREINEQVCCFQIVMTNFSRLFCFLHMSSSMIRFCGIEFVHIL